MKMSAFLFLLPLAACASLDIDGARVGFSASVQRAKNTVEIADEQVTERGDGENLGGRIELVHEVQPDLQVGLVLGYSESAIETVGIQNYDAGMAVRQYFTDGKLRPFFEGRLGYRYAEAQVPFATGGHLDAVTAGAGLGLELQLGRGVSLFGQVDYGGAWADGYQETGLGGTVGFSLRF